MRQDLVCNYDIALIDPEEVEVENDITVGGNMSS